MNNKKKDNRAIHVFIKNEGKDRSVLVAFIGAIALIITAIIGLYPSITKNAGNVQTPIPTNATIFTPTLKPNPQTTIPVQPTATFTPKSTPIPAALSKISLSEFIDFAKIGDLYNIKLAISEGIKVNDVDNTGRTALMWASLNGHLELIKYLVTEGANINEQDKKGQTALILAVTNNNHQIVKYLIESKANVNIKNFAGNSALTYIQDDDMKLLLKRAGAIND